MSRIAIPVSAGELVDKVTILEIKAARISDPAKLKNVRHELDALGGVLLPLQADEPRVVPLQAALRSVNEALWEIEDEIRDCERRRDFGPRFVELARSVYLNNDRRAALKREIDALLGSEIIEEKSYTAY